MATRRPLDRPQSTLTDSLLHGGAHSCLHHLTRSSESQSSEAGSWGWDGRSHRGDKQHNLAPRRCDGVKPPRCIRKQAPSHVFFDEDTRPRRRPSQAEPSLLRFVPSSRPPSLLPSSLPPFLLSLTASQPCLIPPPPSTSGFSSAGYPLAAPDPLPGFADAKTNPPIPLTSFARSPRRFEIKLPVGRRIRNKPSKDGSSDPKRSDRRRRIGTSSNRVRIYCDSIRLFLLSSAQACFVVPFGRVRDGGHRDRDQPM